MFSENWLTMTLQLHCIIKNLKAWLRQQQQKWINYCRTALYSILATARKVIQMIPYQRYPWIYLSRINRLANSNVSLSLFSTSNLLLRILATSWWSLHPPTSTKLRSLTNILDRTQPDAILYTRRRRSINAWLHYRRWLWTQRGCAMMIECWSDCNGTGVKGRGRRLTRVPRSCFARCGWPTLCSAICRLTILMQQNQRKCRRPEVLKRRHRPLHRNQHSSYK